jgi:hypothetical protein
VLQWAAELAVPLCAGRKREAGKRHKVLNNDMKNREAGKTHEVLNNDMKNRRRARRTRF